MESNPYAPPQVTILSAPLSRIQEAEAIRREHINVEATVKSVGTLYYLSTFLMIMIVLMVIFVPTMDKSLSDSKKPFLLLLTLGLGFLQYLIGYGAPLDRGCIFASGSEV